MFPIYWNQFLENHQLTGHSACLDEVVDLSTIGADMRFLTEVRSIDELTNFWPGIGVSKGGYVPVASCSIGSGDYYYINANDGRNGPLYRVHHDAVSPDGYKTEYAVAKVLDHYEELLHYVES